MHLQNYSLMKMVIVLSILVLVTPGIAQVKSEEKVAFPGVIEWVQKEERFIVVNETKISVPSETQIVDGKGTKLTFNDLKPRTTIMIHALKRAGTYVAQSIVIRPVGRNS